ncbi:hypothetical protein [Microbulbifer sp. VAAF005]|uniref:hypothetical protein n=1 Tax=Microbulbifer sp. VAAF005 TaxID=3034230 RepID=UPI0024AE8124|nr:hypothetical protein [Microbulbifer sp. VAAF005]WHI46107.1 hypothetical protein P0078_20675 [Microbulbifer sp. VAAF005]
MLFRLWPIILIIILNVFVLGASTFAEGINSEACWSPRFGGLLVGLAVLMQGYAYANPDTFNAVLSNGTTLEQWTHHAIYISSVFGTIYWAFGDLFGPFLWLTNSACMR